MPVAWERLPHRLRHCNLPPFEVDSRPIWTPCARRQDPRIWVIPFLSPRKWFDNQNDDDRAYWEKFDNQNNDKELWRNSVISIDKGLPISIYFYSDIFFSRRSHSFVSAPVCYRLSTFLEWGVLESIADQYTSRGLSDISENHGQAGRELRRDTHIVACSKNASNAFGNRIDWRRLPDESSGRSRQPTRHSKQLSRMSCHPIIATRNIWDIPLTAGNQDKASLHDIMLYLSSTVQ